MLQKRKSELEKLRKKMTQKQETEYYAMQRRRKIAGETLRRKYYSGSVDATLRRLTSRRRR